MYKRLEQYFKNPNYLYFLLSLLVMLVIPSLAPLMKNGIILMEVTYGLVIFLGIFYASQNFKELLFFGIIGSLVFFLFIYEQRNVYFSILNALLTFIFFTLIFLNVIRYILINSIGVNEIYACIVGYLVLGVMAAPLFFITEQTFENAFQLPEHAEFYDFIYFSFITLTSVGFGDISPIHSFAKGITIIISIFGQLYLTILIAIIIGKFLATREHSKY